MKKFSLYTEELNFDDKDGKNIMVGSYDTDNFDICQDAVNAFEKLAAQKGVDMRKVEMAAKFVDKALGVEKAAMDRGYSTSIDLERFEDAANTAEEILDELDDLENHQSYIRDTHEAALIDMLDIDAEFPEEDFVDSEDPNDEMDSEEDILDKLDEEYDFSEMDSDDINFEEADLDNLFDE